MEKNQRKSFSKYLPSKKFSIIMGSVLAAAAIFFILSSVFSGKISFTSEKAGGNPGLSVQNKTLTELIQIDSDGDGVPDWEEALWGTDPHKKATFDGVPDATYIAEKKKAMGLEQNNLQNEQNLNETEKFAREFFSSFAALKVSGQADATTIKNFSNALGQKVVEANLPDKYSEKEAIVSPADSPAADQKYYSAVKALFDRHKKDGLGSELGIVSSGLAVSGVPAEKPTSGTSDKSASGATDLPSTTPGSYAKLETIGQSYQDFAKEVMQTSVPASLLPYHLVIANSAYNTGVAVMNMRKMIEDPVVGLSGISQYQKYSAQLVTAVTNLQEALMR